jgi:hypothetical protein
VIAGTAVEQHAEAALSASRPPSNANAAQEWGIWKIRLGIKSTYIGCTGIQFDTVSGTDVLVLFDRSAPARPSP